MIGSAGSIDRPVYFYIVQDNDGAAPGEPISGLIHSDLDSASYVRQGSARVAITPITLASAGAAHADGGFVEVDAVNSKGLYRLDLPDAAYVGGVDQVFAAITIAAVENAIATPIAIDIFPANFHSTVISPAGAVDSLMQGILNGTLTESLENLMVTNLDVFLENGGAASTAILNDIGDVLRISGDTAAADNLEAMYDGTGYAADTAPASRAQVGGLGGGSSSGFNYAPTADNTSGAIIDGVTFVGSQTGTFANVAANPATFHQIDGVGDAIDLVYRIPVGSVNQAISVDIELYLNSNNDTLNIQLYDHVGTGWDTYFVVTGKSGSAIDSYALKPLAKHTGALGTAEAGNVYVRFVATGQSSPSLFVAISIAEGVASESINGYEAGAVYCDEVSGKSSGTTQGVDGIFANQSDDFDNAQTIVDNLGSSLITLRSGNSITLTAGLEGYEVRGGAGAINLGSQNIGTSVFREFGMITGVGTSTGSPCFFDLSVFGVATCPPSIAQNCGFGGTYTMGSAGDYSFVSSYSTVAGDGSPVFTKTPTETVTGEWRDWKGGVTINNIEAGDVHTIGGAELGTITLNGADGTVEIRGIYKAIVDNRTGSPVLNIGGAILASDVASTLVDTAEIGVAGAGLTDLGGMSAGMEAGVNAAADAALSDYDGPTNAQFEARTPTAAQLDYIVKNAATAVPITFTTAGGTPSNAVFNQVDGAAPDPTNDQYKHKVIYFDNGAIASVESYVGGTTSATISTLPFAPSASTPGRLV